MMDTGVRIRRTALVALAVVGGVAGVVVRVVTAVVAFVRVTAVKHVIEEAAKLCVGNGQQREKSNEVSHFAVVESFVGRLEPGRKLVGRWLSQWRAGMFRGAIDKRPRVGVVND